MFVSLTRSKYRALELGVMNLQGAANISICPPFWRSMLVEVVTPSGHSCGSKQIAPNCFHSQPSKSRYKVRNCCGAQSTTSRRNITLQGLAIPPCARTFETLRKNVRLKQKKRLENLPSNFLPVVPMLLPVKTCPLAPFRYGSTLFIPTSGPMKSWNVKWDPYFMVKIPM